jgi:outer membrane protein TolC
MKTRIYLSGIALAALGIAGLGCRGGSQQFKACSDSVEGHYHLASAEIEYPAVNSCSTACFNEAIESLAPRTLSTSDPAQYQDIHLAEVVEIAFANTKVLSDVGGAVVRTPGATRTIHDPSITETDPAFGIESALSAFDAQWTTSLYAENNDRALNNEFFGGGARVLQQNTGLFQTQLTKRSVTGTELTARKVVEFDGNNAPANLFPNAWTAKLEGEVRHPLLQGGGMEFNRIAGPNRIPGIYTGVVLARLNTDVQLADFEIAVRNYVSNVENAYWDLYFAYRDLDAKIAARDAALETWQDVKSRQEVGKPGGETEKEAQAREQYYRFQEEVENSLGGRLFDGTRTANGSQGGTFRGTGGVLVAERRLRRLMNLPASDGRLLRPADEPVVAPVHFDWTAVSNEAVTRRAELRRQQFRIRGRELELIASKNHLLPRLDAVGRYRFRGFGKDLFDENDDNLGRFDNAYDDLVSGDFQEWQVGVELDVPIGFRRAHTAVRNAELQLARERAIFCDQQEEVVHEVAASLAEVDRAYVVSQTAYNRLLAGQQQVEVVQLKYSQDNAPLDLLLDAQRRLAEAQSRYYLALTEYAVAIKNVHFSKGTLLEYDNIYLAEGMWPGKAYRDAAELEARRGAPRPLNYASAHASIVSRGDYPQRVGDHSVVEGPLPATEGLSPGEPTLEMESIEVPEGDGTSGGFVPEPPAVDWSLDVAQSADALISDQAAHLAAPKGSGAMIELPPAAPRVANESLGPANPFK